ncbi:MAG: GNAT family N-acetyltransferase [Candidatus Buchananbacteria bacterium]
MVKLVKPNLKYQKSFIEAAKEFQAENRYGDLNIFELKKDFFSFIKKLNDSAKGINLPKGYVAYSTHWLIDNGEFVGKTSIRHRLTKKLRQEGGHIGYEIRPTKRRLGYGTKILKLVLPKAKKLGFGKVLLTCNDDNIGSIKIIEKNGGVFLDKILFNKKLKRRYWLNLNK